MARLDRGGTYDAANRLTEDTEYTYTYDPRGNLIERRHKTTGARTVYTWDARDRLVRIERYPDATAATPTETVTYAYGPLGRRWSRTRAGTTHRFLYDGLDRIATLDPAGTLLEWVTFGPGIDEPLGREDAAGRRLWYRANHQASVMALEDGATATDTYRYSPYGITTAAGTTPNDFRYTGREYEAPDLYYYRARYYDPTVGRFLGEDPVGYLGGYNLYLAFNATPSTQLDPLGLWPTCTKHLIGVSTDISQKILETVLLRFTMPVPIPKAPTLSPDIDPRIPPTHRPPLRPGLRLEVWLVRYSLIKKDILEVKRIIEHYKVFCSEEIIRECGRKEVFRTNFLLDLASEPVTRLIRSTLEWRYELLRLLGVMDL